MMRIAPRLAHQRLVQGGNSGHDRLAQAHVGVVPGADQRGKRVDGSFLEGVEIEGELVILEDGLGRGHGFS